MSLTRGNLKEARDKTPSRRTETAFEVAQDDELAKNSEIPSLHEVLKIDAAADGAKEAMFT